MSPTEFVRQGLVPGEFYVNHQQALSLASYHFRELEKEGCVEVSEVIPRRGAAEHIYKGVGKGMTRASVQGLIARTEGAIRSGTFDKKTGRLLHWSSLHMDEDGWGELSDVLAEALEKAEGVRKTAEERLRETGKAGFPATFAILSFESPPHDLRF